MTIVYFTADLHLGHDEVAEERGFATTAEHDAAVLDGLESTLRAGDILWVLGDLAKGGKADRHQYDAALTTLADMADRIDFGVHLILGNRDRAHPQHTRSAGAEQFAGERLDSVGIARLLRLDQHRVMASHFPYDGDRDGIERYTQWRLRDEGLPVLHGHTHSTQKISYSTAGTVQVCVSLDAWDMRPASRYQVVGLLTGATAGVAQPVE